MHVRQLDLTDRRDVRRYVEFPFRLYRDSALWVPPFVDDVHARLDPRRDPFYQHSDAAFFLASAGTDASSGNEVVGRVAVLDNAHHNQHSGERTAFLWHFDVIDDTRASRALLDAAFEWARDRGLDTMWGPRGFSPMDGRGVLVDGFEHRPAMGVPYNYPYYADLLEDAGFEKDVDLISYSMDRQFQFPERYLEVAERVRRRRGYQALRFRTKAELRAVVPRVAAAYNSAFSELKGFVPITEAEARAVGERILTVADPTMIKVLTKGDEVVGFVIAYPDLSAAIQRSRGRIWPTGWMHLMRERKRTRWININGMAILEGHRGLGGNAVLYAEMYDTLVGHAQYQHADLVQVQDVNARMLQELRRIGVKPYKRHRVYRRPLN